MKTLNSTQFKSYVKGLEHDRGSWESTLSDEHDVVITCKHMDSEVETEGVAVFEREEYELTENQIEFLVALCNEAVTVEDDFGCPYSEYGVSLAMFI